MKTRSTFSGEHQSLPYKEEPVWVHIHELYNAEKNNMFEILLDERDKDKKTWDKIQDQVFKKRMFERTFYMMMTEKTMRCFFLEDIPDTRSLPLVDRLMKQGFVWIQRIRYRNVSSHVKGICDGLMLSRFLKGCEGGEHLPEQEQYVLTLLKPSFSFQNGIDAYKNEITAHLTYCRHPWICTSVVLVVGKEYKMRVYKVSFAENMTRLVTKIRRVKRISHLIDMNDLPPCLYPNMKVSSVCWDGAKTKVAEAVGEITMLWYCNDQHRQLVAKKGIFSWKDERLTPHDLGFTDSFKSDVLERILTVNRSQNETQWMVVSPSLSRVFPEILTENKRNLFIDFEYIEDVIYLIGVFDSCDGTYRSFWSDRLDKESCQKLFQEFQEFLQGVGEYQCWYWYAEKKAMEKASIVNIDVSLWFDLCEASKHTAMRGAFNFSLKSFVKAMHNEGKIPFSYTDLECQNGKSSIHVAQEYYETRDTTERDILERYNRYDCEAMWYIFTEIKKHLV